MRQKYNKQRTAPVIDTVGTELKISPTSVLTNSKSPPIFALPSCRFRSRSNASCFSFLTYIMNAVNPPPIKAVAVMDFHVIADVIRFGFLGGAGGTAHCLTTEVLNARHSTPHLFLKTEFIFRDNM